MHEWQGLSGQLPTWEAAGLDPDHVQPPGGFRHEPPRRDVQHDDPQPAETSHHGLVRNFVPVRRWSLFYERSYGPKS